MRLLSAIDGILILVVLGNLAAFGLFAFDKSQARTGGKRVSEQTLLAAVLIGGLGAWMGQNILRHKTRKEPFRTWLGLLLTLYLLAVVCGAAWLVWPTRG
ncbi:MAG: DUF1294 domain-containing protein [Brevundimonas sp.]|uniref:DUF1294 domain-containing protein n=1 Tax=Brevundimonas sp. TaxID=1871086 RepID=UPI003918EED8